MVVAKTVHTPAIPPKPDVLILADTTGSMGPTLSGLQSGLNTLVSDVQTAQPDAQFGVADYKDAVDCPDPYAYQLDQSITASLSAVQTAVNGYSASGGCDTPEQQLNALYQIATDSPPVGFRSGSTRVVAWFGDSTGHDPSYGHTLSDVIAALQAANIRVVAVPINSGFGDGLDSTGQATAITSATGGSLVSTADPSDVASAILSGLQNLPVTVTPTADVSCDPNLSLSWAPTSQTVTSGTDASFTETITVSPSAVPGSTLTCTVHFLLNGSSDPNFDENITISVPKHAAALTVNGATSDFHDPGTVSAKLIDSVTSAPLGGQSVTFTLNGAETCTGITLADGTVSCQVTPNEAAATYSLTAAFSGDSQHLAASGSASYVVTLEETTTTYTGPTVIANGQPVTLSGVLTEDGITPINGRTLTLTLGTGGGAQSCTGTTNPLGVASCTIGTVNQPLGSGTVKAAFAGDAFYLPSSDTRSTVVFAFLAKGSFVIGNNNAAINTNVNFWGSQWATNNSLSGGSAPSAFKGFANLVSANPPTCGASWTTTPGNSPPPPAGPLPSYMGVIVASHVTQSGLVISGNITKIVVVHTGAGYTNDPGHPGTGTVVATYC